MSADHRTPNSIRRRLSDADPAAEEELAAGSCSPIMPIAESASEMTDSEDGEPDDGTPRVRGQGSGLGARSQSPSKCRMPLGKDGKHAQSET